MLKIELEDCPIDLGFASFEELLSGMPDEAETMDEGEPDEVPAEAQGEPVGIDNALSIGMLVQYARCLLGSPPCLKN